MDVERRVCPKLAEWDWPKARRYRVVLVLCWPVWAKTAEQGAEGQLGGAMNVPLGSPPLVGGGVIAENAAKGQGLLRRLSLGGAGRGRVSGLSCA